MARILLVGCGKMGGAMLSGWLDRGLAAGDVVAVEPAAAVREDCDERVAAVAALDAVAADFVPDVVVFAVKPQVMAEVVPDYARFAAGGATFLSIAAGKTIAFFEELLGARAAVVRAMPNTPAAVRRGITVACANARVQAPARALCQELLEAVGEVAWTEDEALMDAVTAVSGSGPAYVFLLTECLAKAGVAAGLPPAMAERLARTTVAGAGELMRLSPQSAEDLRRNVTSPGGTTAAALEVLMGDGALERLMAEAVAAATRRGRELAG